MYTGRVAKGSSIGFIDLCLEYAPSNAHCSLWRPGIEYFRGKCTDDCLAVQSGHVKQANLTIPFCFLSSGPVSSGIVTWFLIRLNVKSQETSVLDLVRRHLRYSEAFRKTVLHSLSDDSPAPSQAILRAPAVKEHSLAKSAEIRSEALPQTRP